MRGKGSMLELVRLYTIQVIISYREGERLSSQCESLYTSSLMRNKGNFNSVISKSSE